LSRQRVRERILKGSVSSEYSQDDAKALVAHLQKEEMNDNVKKLKRHLYSSLGTSESNLVSGNLTNYSHRK